MTMKLLSLAVTLIVTSNFPSTDASNIFCLPKQFSATLLLNSGTVFIDANTAFTTWNGTVNYARDEEAGKAYINITGTQRTPLVPGPQPFDMVLIMDYKTGVQYTIQGGTCEKDETSNTNLCIPDDAAVIGDLKKGGHDCTRYSYYSPGSNYFVQVTLMHGPQGPTPVSMVSFLGSANPDSGNIYMLDVIDARASVPDPSVFVPPQMCQNAVSRPVKKDQASEKAP